MHIFLSSLRHFDSMGLKGYLDIRFKLRNGLLLQMIIPLLVQPFTISQFCDETYKPWSPSWALKPRDDLGCQVGPKCSNRTSQVKSEEYDQCCACRSCVTWAGTETELFIEYVSVLGRSLILANEALTDPDAVFKIDHVYSEMTDIPSNLCNWDNDINLKENYLKEFDTSEVLWKSIVKINFRGNKIRKVENLNCLVRLDELNLRNNRITFLSNTSFTNLTHLRSVDFSYNLIQKIDPGILTSAHLNIFHADFSRNNMSELDVSNMISLYPFCHINFQSNKITKLVNEANFTLEMTKTYGPGFVGIRGNQIEEFPDFKELLHLDDLSQMGHLFSFGFDLRDIPLICDCHLENFMSLADGVIKVLWRDYMNVTCTGPEDLAGVPVGKVKPERFVCNLDAKSNCPTPFCSCSDKPNEDTLFIDCTVNHTNHLDHVPKIPVSKFSHKVSLNFSRQHLTNLTELTSISNISMLDVSQNDVQEITNDIAKTLENASFVDISDNKNLHQLPKLFLQYRNVCSTNMKNLEIDCDCESLWIEEWLRSKTCINNDFMFKCILPKGEKKPALSFKAADIVCFTQPNYVKEFVIAGAIVILIFTGTVLYIFRYDLLILGVRMKQLSQYTKTVNFQYDVFLSYNDNDQSAHKWVKKELEEYLFNAGYRVFRPSCDIDFGAERDSEVLTTMRNTRNFLLILTDSYLAEEDDGCRPWTENEWKYGWYNFLRDRSKNIVLVNFDHVSSFDVDHPQIKAFLHVGCTIDFNNHKRDIIQDIFRKLGKPFIPPAKNDKALKNRNKRFQHQNFNPTLHNNIGCNEEFDADRDTGHTQVGIPCLKTASPLETDADQVPHISCKGNIIQKNSEKIQETGRFACYYRNEDLKKTPHIPVFRKQPSTESNQTHTESSLTKQKLEHLSRIYTTTTIIPKCIQSHGQDTAKCFADQNALKKFQVSKYLTTSKEDIQNDSSEESNFEKADNKDSLLPVSESDTIYSSMASLDANTEDIISVTGSECSSTLSTSSEYLGNHRRRVASSGSSFQITLSTGSMTDVSV